MSRRQMEFYNSSQLKIFAHKCAQFQITHISIRLKKKKSNTSSLLLICNKSILRLSVQFEVSVAEAADQRSGQQSHAGDGQQLQQPLPGEKVVQRRHL